MKINWMLDHSDKLNRLISTIEAFNVTIIFYCLGLIVEGSCDWFQHFRSPFFNIFKSFLKIVSQAIGGLH